MTARKNKGIPFSMFLIAALGFHSSCSRGRTSDQIILSLQRVCDSAEFAAEAHLFLATNQFDGFLAPEQLPPFMPCLYKAFGKMPTYVYSKPGQQLRIEFEGSFGGRGVLVLVSTSMPPIDRTEFELWTNNVYVYRTP